MKIIENIWYLFFINMKIYWNVSILDTMKVKVTQSCMTFCDPMNCIQARILEWVAYLFSSRLSQPRNQSGVSCTAGGFFTSWATRKPKEGWASKNWCFQTTVLEKTPESPLYCKEINPVNPKGNQPWIFTGRTDAKAEAPLLSPPDAKNWLIERDSNAGKDWG